MNPNFGQSPRGTDPQATARTGLLGSLKFGASVLVVYSILVCIIYLLHINWPATSSAKDQPLVRTVAGALSFPAIICSKPILNSGQGSPAPLFAFEWATADPFVLSWPWWLFNGLLWAAVLNIIWLSAKRPTTSPMRTVALLVVTILLGCVGYLFYVSIPFSDKWRDFISVLGTCTTIVGFTVAIKQIEEAKRSAILAGNTAANAEIAANASQRAADLAAEQARQAQVLSQQAKTAVDAAQEAASTTQKENRDWYVRFSIAEAQRYFTQAADRINHASETNNPRDWARASDGLWFVAERIGQLQVFAEGASRAQFAALAQHLRDNAIECERITGGGRFKRGPWNEAVTEFWELTTIYNLPLPAEPLESNEAVEE